jgi:hypothetical protein
MRREAGYCLSPTVPVYGCRKTQYSSFLHHPVAAFPLRPSTSILDAVGQITGQVPYAVCPEPVGTDVQTEAWNLLPKVSMLNLWAVEGEMCFWLCVNAVVLALEGP